MDEDFSVPEAAQDQEDTVTCENPATSEDATVDTAAPAEDDADNDANADNDADETEAAGNEDEEEEEQEEEENTNMSGDGTVEMLQENADSNEEEEEEATEETSTSKTDMAQVSHIDENTILLPVAGENGFVAEDTAVGFNPSDFLQEEEDVIDPMAGTANRLAERAISQVPKKRRLPEAMSYEEDDDSPERNQKRRGRKPGTKVINGQVIYPSDELVNSIKKNNPRVKLHSMTSAPSNPKPLGVKSSTIGQVDENQCRVCTSDQDLVSIFKKEFQKTYADKLMAISSAITILRDDFMPQVICRVCVSSVNAAFALKLQCEETDAEFREVLQTPLKKIRKLKSYVDSDAEDIPEPIEDQDFKLSDAELPSVEDDDSDSDKPLLKKRPRQRSRKSSKMKSEKRRKRSKASKESSSSPLKKIKRDPDMNTSKNSEDAAGGTRDFSSASEDDYSPPKRRRGKGKKMKMHDSRGSNSLTCNICHETCNSREELREHKKTVHSSFDCELCGRKFKMQSSLKTHMEKHTSLKILNCEPCNLHFPNKTERRRHMQEAHKDAVAQFSCGKCKRAFTSETRLQKHSESNCPGFDTSQKKRGDLDSLSMGKDLFKCVAPLTTTYWSDSFSD